MIPFLSLKDVTALHGVEIAEAVQRVIYSGWYLQGQELERFEKNYADFIGTNHCVGVANGLDALIRIYRAYIELGVMQVKSMSYDSFPYETVKTGKQASFGKPNLLYVGLVSTHRPSPECLQPIETLLGNHSHHTSSQIP